MHGSKHGKVTMHPVANSSHIQAIGYEPDKKELHVNFQGGGQGHHTGVDYATFTVLLTAPSKGKAYNTLVKGKYPWVRHEKESPRAGE
jgi:hypothetical protein